MTSKERASSLIDSFCPHAGTGSTRLASNCLLCIECAIEDAEREATEREKERLLVEIKQLLQFRSCSCCHAIEVMIRGEKKE